MKKIVVLTAVLCLVAARAEAADVAPTPAPPAAAAVPAAPAVQPITAAPAAEVIPASPAAELQPAGAPAVEGMPVPAVTAEIPVEEPPVPRADFTVIIDASAQMDEKKGQAVSSLEAAVQAAVDVAHVGVPVVSSVYWKDSSLHPLDLKGEDHRTLIEKVRSTVGEAMSVTNYMRQALDVNDRQHFIIVSDGSILNMEGALFDQMTALLRQRPKTTIDFLVIKQPALPLPLWKRTLNTLLSRTPPPPKADLLEGIIKSLRSIFPSQVSVWAAENENVKVQLNRILTLYKRTL